MLEGGKQKVVYFSVVCLSILLVALGYYVCTSRVSKHFKVWFLNVGQGDAALIRFDTGEKMLVDCGADRRVLSELGQVLPVYDRTIDYLLVTHPDLDHFGGCIDVVRRYRVRRAIVRPVTTSNTVWAAFLGEIRVREVVVEKVPTSTLVVGSARLDFLTTPNLDNESSSDNNNSIVFRLSHAQRRFLFTGDIEAEREKELVAIWCGTSTSTCSALQAEVLKVPHHGSDTSSSDLFLDAVRPMTAVISVGKNSFGHPSRRVIRRLQRAGAIIERTDEMGRLSF